MEILREDHSEPKLEYPDHLEFGPLWFGQRAKSATIGAEKERPGIEVEVSLREFQCALFSKPS